jgi:hypothetical protein
LVKVVFTPEKRRARYVNTGGIPMAASGEFFDGKLELESSGLQSRMRPKSLTANYSSGVTGLSGSSSQEFGIAGPIEYNTKRRTTLYLRLVSEDDDNEPYPLSVNSTPIPPRV